MPITSAPIDQTAFTRLMLVSITPRTDRDTGVQLTNRDGTERKWTVEVVASLPSRCDSTRNDTEVLAVTVTTADDPTGKVAEGDQVWFSDFTVGVMAPEAVEGSTRIRGGKLFWQASGVQSRSGASGKS